MNTLNIKTSKHNEFIDITDSIQSLLENQNIQEGLCIVYIPHTTGAVTINEGHDPDVVDDIQNWLSRQVPKGGYKHAEGNSDAHIKSCLVGGTEKIIIQNNKLKLGTWEKIFFCEFDGPRSRKVYVKFIN